MAKRRKMKKEIMIVITKLEQNQLSKYTKYSRKKTQSSPKSFQGPQKLSFIFLHDNKTNAKYKIAQASICLWPRQTLVEMKIFKSLCRQTSFIF
jgi:hypothetical protein